MRFRLIRMDMRHIRPEYRGKTDESIFSENPAYYTRVGVAGGVCIGMRLEVNPGEFVDWILGFFTVDIYGDDSYSMPEAEAMQ